MSWDNKITFTVTLKFERHAQGNDARLAAENAVKAVAGHLGMRRLIATNVTVTRNDGSFWHYPSLLGKTHD
jgi:hypothetical protein